MATETLGNPYAQLRVVGREPGGARKVPLSGLSNDCEGHA